MICNLTFYMHYAISEKSKVTVIFLMIQQKTRVAFVKSLDSTQVTNAYCVFCSIENC